MTPITYWTRARVIDACQQWAHEHGRPPKAIDWRKATPSHPNTATACDALGTWNELLRAAGLEPRPAGSSSHYTRADIIQAIYAHVFEHGRIPRELDWRTSHPSRPSAQQTKRLFGTWNAAIVAAGYPPRQPRRTLDGYRRQAGAQLRARDAGRFLEAIGS